jgi:hypothetical protein
MHNYSKIPSRQKNSPEFQPKKQKILAINPKTNKTPFYPLLFLLKNHYFLLFFTKKAKKGGKTGKKANF